MPKRIPTDQVISMVRQGYSDSDIIAYFRDAGYSTKEINDALNQAKIKIELAETAGEEYEVPETPSEEMPTEAAPAPTLAPAPSAPAPEPAYVPAPAPEPAYAEEAYPAEYYPEAAPAAAYPAEAPSVEAVEEIAEGIISEKWEEFKTKVGDIGELKSYMESRLNELNDRVKRLEIAMDRLHAATLAKVEAQSRSVKTLSSEVQALEGTLGKVLKPLVGSVKELREVTKAMRKTKPTPTRPAVKPKKK